MYGVVVCKRICMVMLFVRGYVWCCCLFEDMYGVVVCKRNMYRVVVC